MAKGKFMPFEAKRTRGITKITVYPALGGQTSCRNRRYEMTDSEWKCFLAGLDVQEIDYEYVTCDAIIIIKIKGEKES